jgi:hypothetical protein
MIETLKASRLVSDERYDHCLGQTVRWRRAEARGQEKPNQSLEPTSLSVTDRACARSAPASAVAHL